MQRLKQNELLAWKNSINRKPLIIRGARQTGKTWLMKAFGEAHYADTIYVNLEKNTRMQAVFNEDFDLQRIIIAIQAETGKTITEGEVLLVFDEIQAAPRAITALKYFQEEAPGLHIMAAGSLLGIALHANISFPVGKVDFLDLHPLNFREFLMACNEKGLLQILESNDWKLITAFKSKFMERLRQYYYVGGMPEAVKQFSTTGNFREVRNIQKQILTAYEQDFSKHPPHDVVPRIRMAWNSIPGQLAKENRKFVYGAIRKGARAKDFEMALSWLVDCRLVHKLHRVSKPAIPLKAYEDFSSFKLFLVDVGLLAAMGDIDAKTLLEGNAIFSEFKGALSEQYVMQELVSTGDIVLYYWTAKRATAEIDFVLQHEGRVFPLEVKAEENLQSKSLKVYHQKFLPPLALRLSMSDYRVRDWLVNVPLYALSNIKNALITAIQD